MEGRRKIMKRIKNIQYFIKKEIGLNFGLICAGVLIFGKFDVRFLIAGIILSLWGYMNLYFAFAKKEKYGGNFHSSESRYRIKKQLKGNADYRGVL